MMNQLFSLLSMSQVFCLLSVLGLNQSAFAEVENRTGIKTVVREVNNQKQLELEVDTEFSATGPAKMTCTRKFCDFQGFKYESNVDLNVQWEGIKNFTLINTFGEILYGHFTKSDSFIYEFFDYQGNWVATIQTPLNGKGPWEISSASPQWTNTLIVFSGLKIAESKPNWKKRAAVIGTAVTVAVAALGVATKAYLSYKSKIPVPAPHIVPNPAPAAGGGDDEVVEIPSRHALYDLKKPLSDDAVAHYGLNQNEVNTLNTHVYLQKVYIEGLPGNEIPVKELQNMLLVDVELTPAIVRVLRDPVHLKALSGLKNWAETEIARLQVRHHDDSDEEAIRNTLTESRLDYLEKAVAADEHKQFVRSRLKGNPKLTALYNQGLGENVFELRAFQEEIRNDPETFSEDFVDFLNSSAERAIILRHASNHAKMTYIREKMRSLKLDKWKQGFFRISPYAEDIFEAGFPGKGIPLETFQQIIRDNSSKITAETLRSVFSDRNLNWIALNYPNQSDAENQLTQQIENEFQRYKR